MKKVLTFLIILIPWFFGNLLVNNYNHYYQSLNLPFFAPSKTIFLIIWKLLYIMITRSIYIIYQEYYYPNIKEYNKTLLINYLATQLFPLIFFGLKSPFLGFVTAIAILISSLFLYYETRKLNVISAKWLIPYIIWNIFLVILTLTIYFMNF